MKRVVPQLILLLILCASTARAEYSDHRGYKIDSLENVVAGWTPERLAAAATPEQFDAVFSAYVKLMWGYHQINADRSIYCAQRVLSMGREKNYLNSMAGAERVLGMHMFGRQMYDSSLVHYGRALEYVDRIAAGEGPVGNNYNQETLDDRYSALYGSIANSYNMMDSIPKAMEYYMKAGEIFERNGWNESNSILWYNIGETWVGEHDYKQALPAYEKSLKYALQADDSLLVANARKGLGGLYLDTGRTIKAIKYLKAADEYYSRHDDQEFRFRLENMDFMEKVLSQQKRQLSMLAIGAIILSVLLVVLMFIQRKARQLRKERDGADAVIDQALSEIGAYEEDEGPAGPAERPQSPSGNGAAPVELTDREAEIMPLLASGLTSQKIADKLCLSLPTIKWYRKKLLDKFEASNTADLIFKAKEQGII